MKHLYQTSNSFPRRDIITEGKVILYVLLKTWRTNTWYSKISIGGKYHQFTFLIFQDGFPFFLRWKLGKIDLNGFAQWTKIDFIYFLLFKGWKFFVNADQFRSSAFIRILLFHDNSHFKTERIMNAKALVSRMNEILSLCERLHYFIG